MQKADLLNALNTPIWFVKTKSEFKTIMKYTADDKQLSSIPMVS